ncbi:ammonium transporter AmtB [Moellerella wisconsensis]|uniref:Ammonium transporter n=4 Tax=Moellerella wisconsensis TaxID=158849 RepID=A0A9Q8Q5H5_9GAMM|nr:ammonium transporter AmtB [Moellerella wisconsensis]KLN96440.1 ammonium transporter [Moellerella wisconsensis]UNH28878.1 ammonium transporter AmtB [Moellerella wisconsensis]UNH32341.1 ammonium transporter AmtB [Moellerella wisconsensis]UNH40513.1 ammonium transporter AmtB [Moellerella wisconsensis]UNH41919.1 ammonium transporter AmtB [Moellerella wisconsensis]
MNKLFYRSLMLVLTCLPFMAVSEPATLDKADNAFMMICTALVLFMILPGIALFYGGLLRAKNVLSLMAQVVVIFALVSVIWIVYGYSIAFSEGNDFFGGFDQVMLKNITLSSMTGSIPQFIHVVFQGAFASLTVALVAGALSERIKFSAVLIFSLIWTTFAYLPMAHMVWGGGWLSQDGALDFAGGTVVHINAAVAGLVGAYFLGKRAGLGKEAIKPHNLPMVFIGAAILFIGWFGFNAGSAGAADEVAALAFINTVVATSGAILSWTLSEWLFRGQPSLLGASSGCLAGLVGITPAAGTVGIGGALIIGLLCGAAGLWGVVVLKRWLKADDVCDVFGVHGVCGIIGCLLTGILTASVFGGTGYAEGMTMAKQAGVQALSIVICIVWTAIVAACAFKFADMTVGLRVSIEQEREGLDVTSHGESAYN